VELALELVAEQAHLVASGVRALALLGSCPAEPQTMLRVSTQLENSGAPGAIPFVLDRGDGVADFGFAASAWVLDLFRWLVGAGESVPARHRHRIRGLLLGYSVEAIRSFEERCSGRLFEAPAA
jgi:hypothetical protein